MQPHIDAVNQRFCDALRDGDAAAVAEVYSADAQLLAPGSPPLRGRDAIEAFWKTGIAIGMTDAELQSTTVLERDDIVVETGRYLLTISGEGGEVVDVGKYCVVHQRGDDGAWRWSVDSFSSDRPAV